MWPFKGNKRQSRLVFLSPSRKMRESLPIGCGCEGAFVMGGVGEEKIRLFHLLDNILDDRGYDLGFLDAEKNVSSIKKELSMGNVSLAENILSKSFENAGIVDRLCQRTFSVDIGIDFHRNVPSQDYRRVLDMNSGLLTVSFIGKGTTYRDSFVSSDGILCYRYYGERVDICDITFEGDEEGRVIVRDDSLVWLVDEDNGFYGYALRAVCDGHICGINDKLCIKNCGKFYLYGKAFEGEGNVESVIDDTLSMLKKKRVDFDLLLKSTSSALSKYMSEGRIDFARDEMGNVESELIRQRASFVSAEMIDSLYKYGQYLSYSLGRLAMNLDCFFAKETDQNSLQVRNERNYLKISRILLAEQKRGIFYENSTFFNKIYEKIGVFEENSKKVYNTSGIFIPTIRDKNGFPSTYSKFNLLCKNTTYLVGALALEMTSYVEGEEREKLMKIARGVADFYESFLHYNERDKVLTSPFGMSPFSLVSDEGSVLSMFCRTDFECARHIFSGMARVCEGEEEKSHYLELCDKIPDVVVDSTGCIKEFDSPSKDLPHSKYLSHLVPYSLGLKMNMRGRDYEKLVACSVKGRYICSFGDLTSRDLVDMALTLSASSQGVDSMEILSLMLRTFLQDNLMFSHYDMSNTAVGRFSGADYINIDVNTALILCLRNILISYSNGVIYLSSDYPKYFYNARAKKIVLDRCLSCYVSISGKKRVINLRLTSSDDREITIMLPTSYRRHKGIKKSIDRTDMSIKGVKMAKNKPVKLAIYF